ncbi:putative metalloprotease [Ixodes scapularis]
MPENVGFVVALMLTAVLAAAGLPSENIVYPRIIQSRDQNGEKTLYIRPGLVLSLEKNRVFSDNFVYSMDDGVNRHDRFRGGVGVTSEMPYNTPALPIPVVNAP